MKNTVMLLSAVLSAGASLMRAQTPNGQAVVRLDPALDELVSIDAKLELVRDGFGVTEGPTWVPTGNTGYLLFTDIAANVIYRMTPDGRFVVIADRAGYAGYDPWNAGWDTLNGRDQSDPLFRRYFLLGANGLAVDREGRIIVAGYVGRSVYRLEKNGKRTLLVDRYEGKRFNGPNDVVFRRDGSIYFTDSSGGVRGRGQDPKEQLPPLGIYRMKDGRLTLVISDIPNPNGLVFSPDEKYLYATAQRRTLRRYDVQPDGTLTNGQLFIDMDTDAAPGTPDGVRVDVKGNIWTTGPGGVWIISPAGKHIGTILCNTPFDNTASLGFGDPDYKTVYFTSRGRLLKMRVTIPGYHVF
jgi:gluconolactonase